MRLILKKSGPMGRPAEQFQTGLIQIKPEDPSDDPDIQNRPRSIPLQGGPIRDIPLLEEGLIGRSSHVAYENPEYCSVFNTLAEQDDSSQSADSMASGNQLVSGTPFIPNFVATASGEIHEEPPTPIAMITNNANSVQNFIPTSTIHSESTIPELAGRVIINEQYPTTSTVTHLQSRGALDTTSHRFPNLARAGKVAKQKIGSVYIDNYQYRQFRDESDIPEITPDGSPIPKDRPINTLYEPARASPLHSMPTPIEGSSKETPIIVRRGPGRPRKHFPDPNKPKRPVGRPRKYPKVDKGSKFQFGRTLKVDLGYKLPIGFKKRGRPRAEGPSAKNSRMYEMAKYLISKRKAGQFDDVTPLLNSPSDPENIDLEDDGWITDPEDSITEPPRVTSGNQLEITPTGRSLGVAQSSEMPKVIKRGRGRPRKDGTPVVGSTVWTSESGTSIVTSAGQFTSAETPTTPTEGLDEPGVISYGDLQTLPSDEGTTSDFETPKPLEKRGRGRPRKDSTLPRSDSSKISPFGKELLIPKHKFKGEERAEMIERAQIYGARDTAIYYSQKLGKSIHENTVMATVRKYAPGVELPKSTGKRMYTKFSPDEKKMLAQYAAKYGFSQTASYFSKIWGKFISMNTVRHALLYKSRKRPKKYRKFTNLLSPPRISPQVNLKMEYDGEKENGTENVLFIE